MKSTITTTTLRQAGFGTDGKRLVAKPVRPSKPWRGRVKVTAGDGKPCEPSQGTAGTWQGQKP